MNDFERFTYTHIKERSPVLTPESKARVWGVQVVIHDGDDHIFVRRDEDGKKTEGHRLRQGVVFTNTRNTRFNSVSGGGAWEENPTARAHAEMQEELGEGYTGGGKFTFLDHIPVFACYQEDPLNRQARLLAGVIVKYQATEQERASLSEVGRFWDTTDLIRWTNEIDSDIFRPAFRLAVHVMDLEHTHDDDLIADTIAQYNTEMVAAAAKRVTQEGVFLHRGVFDT